MILNSVTWLISQYAPDAIVTWIRRNPSKLKLHFFSYDWDLNGNLQGILSVIIAFHFDLFIIYHSKKTIRRVWKSSCLLRLVGRSTCSPRGVYFYCFHHISDQESASQRLLRNSQSTMTRIFDYTTQKYLILYSLEWLY